MPVFQGDEDLGNEPKEPPPSQPLQIISPSRTLRRKLSEESIRTDLCEGMLPDSPPAPIARESENTELISDRAELIERLKRGESPTWVPNRRRVHSGISPSCGGSVESLIFPRTSPSRESNARQEPEPRSLLPPAQITPDKPTDSLCDDDVRLREGHEIERPRSALHSGDFRERELSEAEKRTSEKRRSPNLGESRPDSHWTFSTSPPRAFAPFPDGATLLETRPAQRRSVPPSLSSSLSSFAYQPPTSPLVQSQSNDDLDLSLPVDNMDLLERGSRNLGRRHTLAAHSNSISDGFSTPVFPPQRSFHRRQGSFQAHQPQRSLASVGSFQLGTLGSPQVPAIPRSRRPSFNSDVSPMQHASMVGSYEESILRGRMSTNPSKPLDFVAQIGVLGIGKCKPSLRCPSHVTLPFPAVFYSYSNTSHGRPSQEDGPSPYVGQVDLENGLSNPDSEQRLKRKAASRRMDTKAPGGQDVKINGEMTREVAAEGSDMERRRIHRSKRRSGSPRCPPGGSYRVPEKGQIQIIIKNPNKTAVKLFLVPYDLSDMEPGTKTFIRQRSYSAGPVVESVPESASDRPILRYLVHLHICCPTKGRYYLYKSIRVVFANRVPDGKETLRNEVTHPEPRFSSYKPVRAMNPPMQGTGGSVSGPAVTMAKALRRQSSGLLNRFDQASRSFQHGSSVETIPVEPMPFSLPKPTTTRHRATIDSSDAAVMKLSRAHPSTPTTAAAAARILGNPAITPSTSTAGWTSREPMVQSREPMVQSWDKLNKGDVGYGGNAFYSPPHGNTGAEGLLTQRLRDLGMQQRQRQQREREREMEDMHQSTEGKPAPEPTG